VEVLDPATDSVRVIGHVGAVDPQNGSLTVVGFRVQVLPATITTDETSQPKSIGDVAVGDNISVEGGPVGDVIVAGRVDTYTNGSGPSITQVMTRVASYANPDIQVMGRTISTNATTTVSEDCVGEKDRPWLFDTAAQGSINQLRMEVFGPVNGELVATHIDVDDGACYPWDY
jgi:hypothetical protein